MELVQAAGAIFLGTIALYMIVVILLTDEGKAGCFMLFICLGFLWMAYHIGMWIMNTFGLVAS